MLLTAIFRHSAVIRLVIFLATTVFIALPASSQEPPVATADEVIARVDNAYDGINSARGHIVRIINYGNEEPERAEGTFAVRKPDLIRIEFGGDIHRVILYDGSAFRLYFPEKNRGYVTDATELSAQEQYVLGAGPYFGNILASMKTGYDFEVSDMYEGNLILKATPQFSAGFAYVLIGISPELWTIRGVEFFDSRKRIVSQTRYLEFMRNGDGQFFPTKVESSTLYSKEVMIETIYLTQVELNVTFRDGHFRIPDGSGTDWIEQPFRR